MYRFFADDRTKAAVGRLAAAPDLHVFVGAGSSKEVGLPTWRELIDELAVTALAAVSEASRAGVRDYLMDSGLLTAAERIEAMLTQPKMRAAIKRALYGRNQPESLVGGPLTTAVARLKMLDPKVRVLTTNYDQLIVGAIRSLGGEANSYCVDSTRPDAILHLHGVIGFEKPADGTNRVVLTEHDYLAPNAGGWRRDAIEEALRDGASLFVGASLTDLNLLTPLHRSASGEVRHVVVFVRSAWLSDDEQEQIEQIESKRWVALGVQPVFADNYSDVAQFIDEVRRARAEPTPYVGLDRRLRDWYASQVVPLTQAVAMPDVETYATSQRSLAASLARLLAVIQDRFALDDEVMQLGLFAIGCDPARGDDFASVVATSDRVMLDPRSNEQLALDGTTSWTGVRAMTSGIPVWETNDNYASRWKHMLAVPVYAPDPVGCCVGAVVLSSTAVDSKLAVIGGGPTEVADYAGLYDVLREAGNSVLVAHRE